jgi:Tol biopolymer transport system component
MDYRNNFPKKGRNWRIILLYKYFPLLLFFIIMLVSFNGCNSVYSISSTRMNKTQQNSIETPTPIITANIFTKTIIPTASQTIFSFSPSPTLLPINTGGGGKIAYLHPEDESNTWINLYIYEFISRTEKKYLVGNKLELSNINWSSNGNKIIFSVFDSKINKTRIMGLDITTNELWTIYTFHGFGIASPSWSPDERYIAFVFTDYASGIDPAIYLLSSDGKSLIHLVHFKSLSPSWSPDGKKIIFFGNNGNKTGIFTININGTNLSQLSDYGEEPVFSPDGTKIVFVGTEDRSFQIFTMNSNGSNVVQINSDGLCPSWSPDGSIIAYSADFYRGWGRIHLIGSDGENNLVLPTIEKVGCPKWSK